MTSLFSLYLWPILSGAVTASALALLGTQWAARDRAMQTLCLGQGALVGVLLGLVVNLALYSSLEALLFPTLIGLVTAFFVGLLSERLGSKKNSSKSTLFGLMYALLVALGHLISSLVPELENHVAALYFGDLVTLSDRGAWLVGGLSAVFIAYFLKERKAISDLSFEKAVFGEKVFSTNSKAARQTAFALLAFLLICLSVQFLGFLFTLGCLYIPTGTLSLSRQRGIRYHYLFCAIVGGAATIAGFTLSLEWTKLPTVPTILWVLFILSWFGLRYGNVFGK